MHEIYKMPMFPLNATIENTLEYSEVLTLHQI